MASRVISALILAPLFLTVVYLGGIPFLFACLVILGFSAWEFVRIYNHDKNCQTPAALLVGMVWLIAISRYFWGFEVAIGCMTVCIMFSMTWGVFSYEHYSTKAAFGFAVMVTGLVYIGWLGSYLISLRQVEGGFWWFILCLFVVWMSDIGAFLVGRKLGRHYMLPKVSPNKTWEGFAGGVILSMLTAALLHAVIPPISELMSFPQALLLGLLISAFGSMGDFGESMIKRTFGVKDSSNLIPGHGGFFDRFDTVFWGMPIGYYFFQLIALGLI